MCVVGGSTQHVGVGGREQEVPLSLVWVDWVEFVQIVGLSWFLLVLVVGVGAAEGGGWEGQRTSLPSTTTLSAPCIRPGVTIVW